MLKFTVSVGGGLGDVIQNVFDPKRGHTFWKRLKNFKDLNSDAGIQILVASHNPSAVELFQYVPWIDEVTDMGWKPSYTTQELKDQCLPGYTFLTNSEAENKFNSYAFEKFPFILTKEEFNRYQILKRVRPYVFLYPFGGYGPRIEADKYSGLVDVLIDQGFNVIIGGASHIRNREREIQETFSYQRKGLFNLIGCSPRLSCLLASEAFAYIGSLGSFMHAAMVNEIKAIFLTCYEIWPFCEDLGKLCPTLWPYHCEWERCNFIRINNEKNLDSLWSLMNYLIGAEDKYSYLQWGSDFRPRVEY